jgi:hypothetical protein
VVDVGHQVLDAVGQHLLPRRAPTLQGVGDRRLAGQALDDLLGLLGLGDDLVLGLPTLGQLAGHEGDFVGHLPGPCLPALATTWVRSHWIRAG